MTPSHPHDGKPSRELEDGAPTGGARPGAQAHGPHEAPSLLEQALAAVDDPPLKGRPLIEVLPLDEEPESPLLPIGEHRLEENGNRSRASKQESRGPLAVEDHAGSVRSPRPGKLIVPEEKRCEALTTRGARCKAPKLRGLRVCMFHGHLSSTDERLMALADQGAKAPRLSPRKALQAVAEMRAGELAVKAVDGALNRADSDGGRAVLALVDAVDPLVDQSASLVVRADDVENLSFAQLTLAVRGLMPSKEGMDAGIDPPPTV